MNAKEKNNFQFEKKTLGEIRTLVLRLPPALLPHHLAIALRRLWIVNKVKFCYFHVNMGKKVTSEWDQAGEFAIHSNNPFNSLSVFRG